MYIIWLGYVLSKGYFYFHKDIMKIAGYLPKIISKILAMILPSMLLLSLLILLLLQLISPLPLFVKMRESYTSGLLFKGTQWYVVPFNMVIDYISKVGLFLFLVPVGLIKVLKEVNHKVTHLFFSIIILFSAPLLVFRQYTPLFVLPLFCLLMAIGLKTLLSILEVGITLGQELQNRHKIRSHNTLLSSTRTGKVEYKTWFIPGFLALCLIASLFFSLFIRSYDVSRTTPKSKYTNWMKEETYQVAKFLTPLNVSIDCASTLICSRIRAIAGIPTNPKERMIIENVKLPGTKMGYRDQSLSEWEELTKASKLHDKIYDNGFLGIWDLKTPR